MPLNTSGFNSPLRAADTEEIKASNYSIEDGITNHLTYGVVDSLTSGAIGVYNSGKALVNAFGGDLALTDENSVIADTFGKNASDYYQRNKAGVDFAGFLAGTLVGGMGALRVVKGATSLGKLTYSMEAATGLSTGEIGLGTKVLQEAKVATLANAENFSWRNPAVYKAMAVGLGKQVTENLVFEAGALLTNNQNALINPDGEGAFQAIGHQFSEGLPFLAGAIGFGTMLESAAVIGAVKNTYRAAEKLAADATIPVTAAINSLPAGDRIVHARSAQTAFEANTALEPSVASVEGIDVSQFIQQRRSTAIKQFQSIIDKAVLEMNKAGDAGLEMIKQLSAAPIDKAAETTAGMLFARLITEGEYNNMFNFFQSSSAPSSIIFGDSRQLLMSRLRNATEANAGNIELNLDNLQAMYKQVGKTTMSFDEFKNVALLYELAAFKVRGNTTGLASLVDRAIQTKSPVLQELQTLSEEMFPQSWSVLKRTQSVDDNIVLNALKGDKELTQAVNDTLARPTGGLMNAEYSDQVVQLLSNAAVLMHHPQYAELSAKLAPETAKLFRDHAVLGLPFSPTRRFFNIRTGLSSDGVIPLANDLGKVSMLKGQIRIEGTDKAFTYDASLFKPGEFTKRLDNPDIEELTSHYLHASSMWAAAAQEDISKAASGGSIILSSHDLPMIERAVTSDNVKYIKLTDGKGKAVEYNKKDAAAYLIEAKAALRSELQQRGMNENIIGLILNSGEKFNLGLDHSDAILMGVRKYDRPENIATIYTNMRPKDVQRNFDAYDAINYRMEMFNALRKEAATAVLGDHYAQFPDATPDKLGSLSMTDTRSSMLFSVHNSFNSFREFASYVGKLTHNIKDESRIDIESKFARHYRALDVPDNIEGRAQLALATNMMRQSGHYLVEADSGKYLVKAKVYHEYIATLDKNLSPEQVQEALSKALEAGQLQGRVKLREDVADFLRFHREENSKFVQKDLVLANAYGRHIVRDAMILYPPPLRLKDTPFFAFITPKGAVEAADPAKYMVYGRTAEELRAKVNAITDAYKGQYDVLYKDESELAKKIAGEYEEGKVFNEWDFDSSMQREGTATDFLPSLDTGGSTTLDLYRNWHHNKAENQLMQAVELKYADIMESLRRADAAYDAPGRSRLGQRVEPSTIFADTRNLMLDKKGYGGIGESLYKQISSWTSGKMSGLLDGYARVYDTLRGKGLSDSAVQQLNDKLEQAGFVSPIEDGIKLALQSSNIPRGRSFDALMRTTNNLVSSFMLRLDPLNSAVQIISTPILLSPVIREAKNALKGSEQGKQLLELTTVVNPANGVREPTAFKMMANSTARWASGEAKDFVAELTKRGFLHDDARKYVEAMDFSGFTGNHTVQAVDRFNDKLAKLSKYTGHKLSEDFSRFLVADAMRQVCELRGITGDEMYSVINTAIDRVHGVYRSSSKAQLFSGVIGQSIGLYQTYMFNFMQNMLRYAQQGDKAALALATALQSTVFGVRSLPAFNAINNHVASTNGGKVDLYTLTGSDNATQEDASAAGLGKYLMYGLGGYALGVPTDIFSRGDMTVRQATVVPTQIPDLPAVSTIAKVVANIAEVGHLISQGVAPKEALAYGLAHNAFNRPLQGIGTVIAGQVTSNNGTPLFQNVNYNEYDMAKGLNLAAIGARILGGKPLREAMLLDTYYRRSAYQAATTKAIQEIAQDVRTAGANGADLNDQQLEQFAARYERAGGNLERFNAFVSKQLVASDESAVTNFRDKMQQDNAFTRTYGRMQEARSATPLWQLDSALK